MDDIELGLREREHRNGNGKLRFTDIHLERDGKVIDSPITGDRFDIVVAFEKHTSESLRAPNFSITVSNLADGRRSGPRLRRCGCGVHRGAGVGRGRLHIDRCPLPAGQYYVDVRADSGTEVLDAVGHGTEITVAAGDFYGSGRQSILGYRAVMIDHAWALEAADTGVSVPDGSAEPGLTRATWTLVHW